MGDNSYTQKIDVSANTKPIFKDNKSVNSNIYLRLYNVPLFFKKLELKF